MACAWLKAASRISPTYGVAVPVSRRASDHSRGVSSSARRKENIATRRRSSRPWTTNTTRGSVGGWSILAASFRHRGDQALNVPAAALGLRRNGDLVCCSLREVEALPLCGELLHDMLWREVQIDRCRREVIVAEEPLEGWEADALLNCRDGEGMAEHVGARRASDPGAVRHSLHEPLDRAGCHFEVIVQCKERLE